MVGALRAACFKVPGFSGKAQKTLPCEHSKEHAQEGRARARLLCRLWMSWGLLGDAFKILNCVLFDTH